MGHVYTLSHSVMSNSSTPRTAAHQGPLFMGFCSKNLGMGGCFLLQGIFWTQAAFLALVGEFFITVLPGKPEVRYIIYRYASHTYRYGLIYKYIKRCLNRCRYRYIDIYEASLISWWVKNPPAMQEI